MTPFSLDDYDKRQKPSDIRNGLLEKISNKIEQWIDPSIENDIKHQYLITNEGLGKSTTVLSLGKKYSFIYALYTKKGVEEKSEYLKSKGIKHKIVLAVETILKNEGFEHLIDDYNQYLNNNPKPTFKKFLENNKKVTHKDKSKLLGAYKNNNQQIHYNEVILMTTAKLKVMLLTNQADIRNDWKPIIIDEFQDSEWKRLASENTNKFLKSTKTIDMTWGGGNSSCDLYKQDSMFDLLEYKNVLILTTERSLAGIYFWKTDYSEMTGEFDKIGTPDYGKQDTGKINKKFNPVDVKDFNFVKNEDSSFDKKLQADNVHFWLVSSTSKDKLLDQMEYFEKFNSKVISDGGKKSPQEILTHLGVKGMNHLSKEDTIVFGTLKPEIVVKELYLNNKEYFQRWVSCDPLNRKGMDKKEELIQKILMETQVSQSIGRNSGFRDNGKKCLVVLPVLHSKSSRRIARDLHLNYISENVYVMDFNPQENQFQKVSNF